jgi:hypothetical protein
MPAPAALASEGGAPARLWEALAGVPRLMGALEAAREASLPDWLLGAGAVRDAVWDTVQGLDARPPRDVDVAFFDPHDLTPGRDAAARAALLERAPDIPWDAKNQAAVHLWYPDRFGIAVPALRSAADGVATWPETATCVAVRLLPDDDLLVVAPYGLDDLLGCVCRHNPARVPAAVYERRVAEKAWVERWPRLRRLPAQPSSRTSDSSTCPAGGSFTIQIR